MKKIKSTIIITIISALLVYWGISSADEAKKELVSKTESNLEKSIQVTLATVLHKNGIVK